MKIDRPAAVVAASDMHTANVGLEGVSMRIPLTAVGVGIVLCFSAAPASGAIAVHEEAFGSDPCPPVSLEDHLVNGGCDIGVEQIFSTTLYQHTLSAQEIAFSICKYTFEMRLNSTGSGYIYNQALTADPLNPACGRTACDEPFGNGEIPNPHRQIPWAAQILEIGGIEYLSTTLCLRAVTNPDVEGSAGFNCTLRIPITTGLSHTLDFIGTELPCTNLNGVVEATLWWRTANGGAHPDDVEIVHP